MNVTIQVDTATNQLVGNQVPSIPRGAIHAIKLVFKDGDNNVMWDSLSTISLDLYLPDDLSTPIAGGSISTASMQWTRNNESERYEGLLYLDRGILANLDLNTLYCRIYWNDPFAATGDQYTNFFHVQYGGRALADPRRNFDAIQADYAQRAPWEGIEDKPDLDTLIAVKVSLASASSLAAISVAAMTANDVSAFAHGTIIKLHGYYGIGTPGGGWFWLDTSGNLGGSAATDGNIFYANDGKATSASDKWYWRRMGHSHIDVTEWGVREASIGDTSLASANNAAWTNIRSYVEARGGNVEIVFPTTSDGGVFTFSSGMKITSGSNITITLKGYNVYAAPPGEWDNDNDTGYAFFFFQSLTNIKLRGPGGINGGSVLTIGREGTSPQNGFTAMRCVVFDQCTVGIAEHLKIRQTPQFGLVWSQGSGAIARYNDVDTSYGSVDALEPDDASGDNNDGIHFYGTLDACAYGNKVVTATDDCIALTILDQGIDLPGPFLFYDNELFCGKAENVAAPGLGSSGTAGTLRRVKGSPIRVENNYDTYKIKNLWIHDNDCRGGVFGIQLRTQNRDHRVENVLIENNRIYETGRIDGYTAAELSEINRSINAGVYIDGVHDIEVRHNDFDKLGVKAFVIRSASKLKVHDNEGTDLLIDETAASFSLGDGAAIFLRNNPSTTVHSEWEIYNNTFEQIDGNVIYAFFDTPTGGGSISGLKIYNNHGKTTNVRGDTSVKAAAYYFAGIDESQLEHWNNTVEGHNEVRGATALVGPTSIRSSRIHSHLTNWTNAVGGFWSKIGGTVTQTVVDEFQGCSKVLKNESPSGFQGIRSQTIPISLLGKSWVLEGLFFVESGVDLIVRWNDGNLNYLSPQDYWQQIRFESSPFMSTYYLNDGSENTETLEYITSAALLKAALDELNSGAGAFSGGDCTALGDPVNGIKLQFSGATGLLNDTTVVGDGVLTVDHWGEFTIGDGTDTSDTLNFQSTDQEIEDALNAMNSGTGPFGDTVTVSSKVITFDTVGAKSLLTITQTGGGDVASIAETTAGDGGTQEQQTLSLAGDDDYQIIQFSEYATIDILANNGASTFYIGELKLTVNT